VTDPGQECRTVRGPTGPAHRRDNRVPTSDSLVPVMFADLLLDLAGLVIVLLLLIALIVICERGRHGG
jgi:hypothetical protein